MTKKRKSESAKEDSAGAENTDGIDYLAIGEATHGWDEYE